MAGKKLVWDQEGSRFYETGVDHGILWVKNVLNSSTGKYGYGAGVAWNGLTNVTESPEGGEVSAIYADNIKYLNLTSVEDFKCSIEAYTFPDEFEECDGAVNAGEKGIVTLGQQTRTQFALYYRTKIGNDENPDYGYKHHIVYGCLASPTEKAYNTVNDSPEAETMSWDITTTPVPITTKIGGKSVKPTAHIEFKEIVGDTDTEDLIAGVLEILYGKDPTTAEGTDGVASKLLMPDELIEELTTTPDPNPGGNEE